MKILAGNPDHRATDGQTNPRPAPTAPEPPTGLPPGARSFWNEHAAKLVPLGLLTEVDGPAFAMLAIHWSLAFKAARLLVGEELTVQGAKGGQVRNALLQVFRDNSTAFRMYAAEFGLTPSARTKLCIPEPEAADDFFGA